MTAICLCSIVSIWLSKLFFEPRKPVSTVTGIFLLEYALAMSHWSCGNSDLFNHTNNIIFLIVIC